MTRVASVPLQRTMSAAIQQAQQKLAVTQAQLATGKKATDLAGLGSEAVRTLSAHTLVARAEAHSAAALRLGTTLSLYDANIAALDDVTSALRQDLLGAIGTGKGEGLQEAIEASFQQLRTALNAREAGQPLFGGARDEDPFTPQRLSDLAGLDPADAFVNDGVRASARVGEQLDVTYGIGADELGTGLARALRTLAEAGAIGDTPTEAQLAALRDAVGQIDEALIGVRALGAGNGRRQAQAETLATRADERALLLRDLISRNEDADLGQVAMDLAQHQTVLEVSYSVFSQLSGLSLVRYL